MDADVREFRGDRLEFLPQLLVHFSDGIGPQGVGAGNLDFGRGKFSDAVSADAS